MRSVLFGAMAVVAVGQNPADGVITDCDGACACVDMTQSSGWHNDGTGQDHFSIRIKVPTWRAGLHVTATWPGFATIDNAYGFADLVTNAEGGGHLATVVLRQTSSESAFILMGHGTAGMPTSFSCTTAPNITSTAGQSSSSSASIDCDLGAQWAVTNPYPQLTDVQVSFDRWETGRTVVLSFANQEFNPVNPRYATITATDTDDVSGSTIVSFVLGSIGTERLCHTGHVNEAGEYVRDTNCASGAGNTGRLFFSFQMQCPTCVSQPSHPDIICHDLSPPPPAPVQQQLPNPGNTGPFVPTQPTHPNVNPAPIWSGTLLPPPPPPSPPPPPQIEATACPSGGMAEVQRRVKGSGEEETLHVVVAPSHWWPTGYVYVVGLRGENLHVWRPEGAELVPQEERGFDQYSIHRYIFSPDPGNHFSFNVDGIDVLLAELTCRKPHAPPSPPLLSPPPPSPPAPFKFSNGLRSFSSRAAVGVLCFLFLLRVLMCLWQSSSGRALRRSCFGGYGQTRTVISAAEDSSSNGGRTDGCWAVLIVVGGKDLEIPLPQTIASNGTELKLALSELANEALGPKVTPSAWQSGDLRSMRVQYVDADERPLTMKSTTRMSDLRASPFLRVTEGK